jgi:hypothetical protein
MCMYSCIFMREYDSVHVAIYMCIQTSMRVLIFLCVNVPKSTSYFCVCLDACIHDHVGFFSNSLLLLHQEMFVATKTLVVLHIVDSTACMGPEKQTRFHDFLLIETARHRNVPHFSSGSHLYSFSVLSRALENGQTPCCDEDELA